MATGRPSKFTEKLAETICQRIAEGESLRAICREEGMPVLSTVLLWVVDGKHKSFSEQYEQACNARAEMMFEELLEIADDGTNDYTTRTRGEDGDEYEVVNPENIQRSRLRVDTRKWFLSKIMPKKFGDKTVLTGPNDGPIQVEGVTISVRKE